LAVSEGKGSVSDKKQCGGRAVVGHEKDRCWVGLTGAVRRGPGQD